MLRRRRERIEERTSEICKPICLHSYLDCGLLAAIMQSRKLLTATLLVRCLVSASAVLTLTAVALAAQTAANPTEKHTPAKIDKQIIVFPESVVQEQWTHTLKLVNFPKNLVLLNPGQCVRIGIVATGDGRDEYLEKAQLSFRVEFAGHSDSHPLAPLAAIKQIKPEGGDFVTAVLNSAEIQNPFLTTASMGASRDKWCVPADAQDGTATVEAETESSGGHQKQARTKVQIESFETGSGRALKNNQEFEDFLTYYHSQPNPARLYPALQFLSTERKVLESAGVFESLSSSFSSILKDNPAAAKDFMARVSTQSGFVRGFGLLALIAAGYDIEPILKTMSEGDQKIFKQHFELPDPYDFVAAREIPTQFDMLWGIFSTTGQFAPIQKIATGLAWGSDWDDFQKALKSPNPPKEWTPAIGRAVAYSAAGWSLYSFEQNDPLAADYIEYMVASPDTPTAIKSELKGLSTNPAFKRKGDK
jgi:hypothetical protein